MIFPIGQSPSKNRTNECRIDALAPRHYWCVSLSDVKQQFLCTCRFLDTGVQGWHYNDWRHWQIDHLGVLTKLFCVKSTNQLLRNITNKTLCFIFINMCSPCCCRHLANGNQVSEHDLPLKNFISLLSQRCDYIRWQQRGILLQNSDFSRILFRGMG